MLKRLAALLLLASAAAYAQTASLIAHMVIPDSGNVSTSGVLTGASAGNALLVVTDRNISVSDSDHHTFVLLADVNGFDTHISVWGALGATISASDTITTDGNYSHIAAEVMVFSNVASFDQLMVAQDGTATTQDVGPLTPTNPNELLVGVTEGTYNTTPSVQFTGSPSSPVWHQLDTGTMWTTPGATFTDAWALEGSGTPTATTLTDVTNQFNGQQTIMLAFTTAASPLPLTTSTTSLPNVMRTKAYPDTCIQVSGGSAPYTITQNSGTLPAGITFDGKCLSGNPTTSGTFSGIVFHIVDHAGVAINSSPLSITVTPFVTVLTLKHPAYGFVLFPSAKRQLGVIETDPGATGKVDYTIPEGSGFASLSCTTNCPGNVQVTITGTAGACTVSGTMGSYSITGGTDFHIVATSRDANEDGSHSTDSAPIHICKGDHLVETQPAYNQAFFGQQKVVYGYVLGQVDQSGTWTCTAPDNSSCNAALADRNSRDVVFTAPSTVGRYKLTYTSPSAYDGTTATNYSWIYVGGPLTAAHDGTTALPITKDHTEAQACFSDPAFGARNYTVKADGTGDFTHIYGLPVADDAHQHDGGFVGRVFNQDATGTSPTQYHDWFIERTGGTRDLPVVICGVTDAAGHLPIMQAQGFTNGPGDAIDGTNFQGGVIEVAPFRGSPTYGYDTSFGPDYVNIWGMAMRDADAVLNHNNDKIGVWGIGGRHLNIEGMSITNMRDGALLNNNTIYFGVRYTEFQSVIGSYFDQCGSNPGYGDHCYYVEGMYPLVVGNHFGTLIDNAAGSWIKNRGGGSIMAANVFTGSAGYTNMWWGDMSDAAPYTNVEMALGPVGDTNCGDSPFCNSAGQDFDIRHIMSNEEALAHDYFYGNIATGSNGAPFFSYAAQNSDGCVADYSVPCTMGNDHTGGFMLWNNTFNNMGVVGQSNDVFYNNGYNRPGVYGWPRLTYQNNSFWTDGSQGTFQLDNSPQFQANFATNLFAAGKMSIASPIQPGNPGWGNSIGGQGSGSPSDIWSAYAPKDSYLSGVTSANFLSAATVPYSTTDFKPTAGSPLVGAGSGIADPLMAVLPVRFEPDPINGFMVARTDSVSTIGARSSSTPTALSISTTSLPAGTVGTAYLFSLAGAGGQTPYTWTITGTLPNGLSINSAGVITGTPTTAGTTTGIVFHVTDSASATAASSVMTLTIAPAAAVTPVSVATTTLPNATRGTAYNTVLTASNGTPPYTWAVTTLPAGLSLNAATGAITGTPSFNGTTNGIVATVTDSHGVTASSPSMSLVVNPPAKVTPPPAPTVTTTNLSIGSSGASYTYTLTATGGTAPYTWAITSGALPVGITLNAATGLLSGTPTTAGTSTGLVFTATDSAAQSGASPTLSLVIAAPPPPPTTTGGTSINGNATITGGVVIQ